MIGSHNQQYYAPGLAYQPYPSPEPYQPKPSHPGRSVLWFLALIFFGWPAAFMICPIYILLSPFSPCCQCMRIITDALLVGVQLPCICSENMIKQVRFC